MPIINKTQLTDSRVLGVVEKWSKQLPELVLNISNNSKKSAKKSNDNSEDSETECDVNNTLGGSSVDDSSLDSNESPNIQQRSVEEEESSDSNQGTSFSNKNESNKISSKDKSNEDKADNKEKDLSELYQLQKTMVELALKLLQTWSSLKEAFRIPKKERIELMKEHEREVDRRYNRDVLMNREVIEKKDSSRYSTKSYYDMKQPFSNEISKDRSSRWNKKHQSYLADQDEDYKNLSKEERRQRFEKKVAEDEAAKQKKMQEDMWNLHVDRCIVLGHDPYYTPIFNQSGEYYWDPSSNSWKFYTGPDPNIPIPATYGNKDGLITSPSMLPLTNISLPGEISPIISNTSILQPSPLNDGSPSPQIFGMPIPGTENSLSPSLDISNKENVILPPKKVALKLPPRWKLARNAEGIIYFYHIKARVSQWLPPTLEQHKIIEAQVLSDSDSDFDSDSDTNTLSSSDVSI